MKVHRLLGATALLAIASAPSFGADANAARTFFIFYTATSGASAFPAEYIDFMTGFITQDGGANVIYRISYSKP